jgi:hypothetical protein
MTATLTAGRPVAIETQRVLTREQVLACCRAAALTVTEHGIVYERDADWNAARMYPGMAKELHFAGWDVTE